MVSRKERDKLIKRLQKIQEGSASREDIDGQYAGEKFPSDPAILAIFDQLYNVSESFIEDDCGRWQDCTDACKTCTYVSQSPERGRSSDAKRLFARSMLFLRSDREYSWAPSKAPWWMTRYRSLYQTLCSGDKMPWWLAPIAAVTALVGLFFCFVVGEPLSRALAQVGITADEFICMLAAAVILAVFLLFLFGLLPEKIRGRDPGYWPFFGREDYKSAL